MKRQFAITVFSLLSVAVMAQTTKLDASLQRIVSAADAPRVMAMDTPSWAISSPIWSSGQPVWNKESILPVVITADDAEALADEITADGYRASVITSTTVTARVPVKYLSALNNNINVVTVSSSAQMQSLMDETRPLIGVDKAQAGEGLDTPYTGKGVIVGVIDQGFEFRHISFLDSTNTPRVVAVWNRVGYNQGTDAEPVEGKENIPANGDNIQAEGHATHVTNIAAGSKISENDYYGIAPDADIIMIPSEFNSAEVLEDVKYIGDYAEKNNQPWVINMSFGGHLGPHDGSDPSAQALSALASNGKGHAIVVAASNDGNQLRHIEYTFQKGETKNILLSPGTYGVITTLWGQATDSLSHLSVVPYLLSNGERDYRDSAFWAELETHTIAPYNGKENYEFRIGTAIGRMQLGLEVTADTMVTLHGWTNTYYGTFATGPDNSFIKPDNLMTIGDFPASAPDAITVGAYNGNMGYTSINSSYGVNTFRNEYGDEGYRASFSSVGPYLGENTQKPTLSAPGTYIKSAVSKYGYGFSSGSTAIVQDVRRGLRHFYYGAMSGTSMATPVVTGSIALWLQANPNLSHDDIITIIQNTCRHDSCTGDAAWTPEYGYGKLDTYEGLKEAIRLAPTTGITTILNSSQPLTILKRGGQWKALLNSSESSVIVSVYDMGGTLVARQNFGSCQKGREINLNFANQPQGVYLIRIDTPRSSLTRKLAL